MDFQFTIYNICPTARTRYIYTCIHVNMSYVEGRSQRLKRVDANNRNHAMKAIAADSWYRVQYLGLQDPSSNILVTLAVEQAAASDRKDRT